jgi:hypothetical protein
MQDALHHSLSSPQADAFRAAVIAHSGALQ